ncbi:ogr/Delta-like zinc finger family protein [Pseudomonas sp. DC3000-4b1]|uniref:ogr/Delta-like zinc finger family protein n=1 Tax=unclassified Pseudomonas TaxID=196821 RepID=UPI003CE6BA8D
MSVYKLVCPHCQGKMRIRTSEGTHVFLRIAYLQCMNEGCGWACRAQFEMTHELSPSAMPRPDVRLPRASRCRTTVPERAGADARKDRARTGCAPFAEFHRTSVETSAPD